MMLGGGRFPRTMEVQAPDPVPDARWMRDRLEELCAIHRPSASPGEREAAEWLAGELRDAGRRASGSRRSRRQTGPSGGRSGSSPEPGARRPRGASRWPLARTLAAASGVAASALLADELLRGGACREPRSGARTTCSRRSAPRTPSRRRHHDAAHSAFFYNRRSPGRSEKGWTRTPTPVHLMGRPSRGPRSSRSVPRRSRSSPRSEPSSAQGRSPSWPTSAPARWCPARTTTGPAASPDRPCAHHRRASTREHAGAVRLHLRRGPLRRNGPVHGAPRP